MDALHPFGHLAEASAVMCKNSHWHKCMHSLVGTGTKRLLTREWREKAQRRLGVHTFNVMLSITPSLQIVPRSSSCLTIHPQTHIEPSGGIMACAIFVPHGQYIVLAPAESSGRSRIARPLQCAECVRSSASHPADTATLALAICPIPLSHHSHDMTHTTVVASPSSPTSSRVFKER